MKLHAQLLPCLRCREAPEGLTCKTALGLQVLQLDECNSLRGKPAAAAILAIAQHGKLGELALPGCLRERQGMVLALLKNSKDLRRLSAIQLRYANASHRGSSWGHHVEDVLQLQRSKHWPIADLHPECCALPASCSFVSHVRKGLSWAAAGPRGHT